MKDGRTHALHSYARMANALRNATQGRTQKYRTDTGRPRPVQSEAHDAGIRRLATEIRSARICLIDPSVMEKATYVATVDALEQIITDEEDKKWGRGLIEAVTNGTDVYSLSDLPPRMGLKVKAWADVEKYKGWPGIKLPFPVSYFAYGMGHELNDLEREMRSLIWVPLEIVVLVRGHLFTDEGDIIEMRELVNMTNYPWEHHGMVLAPWANMPAFASVRLAEVGQWEIPMMTSTWAAALASWVVDRRTEIWPASLSFRDKFRFGRVAGASKKKPPPPPFYVVKISDEAIGAYAGRGASEGAKIEWRHRWDVRGHHRAYVKRGPKPLERPQRDKLRSLGYKVYEGGLDAAAFDVITSRRLQAPEPGEWVAIKTAWVKAHVKGPKDKPHVRSIRTKTA